MTDKLPCKQCNEMILQQTAEKTGGICMACKQGIRKSIEQSKEFYLKQKEYDPYRELWTHLVNKAYTVENGFEMLTKEEKLYFSVGIFDGEVYIGGMYQFFSNSSGELYEQVVEGLKTLKATKSLSLLKQAVRILFDKNKPPKDRLHRWQEMKQFPEDKNELRPKWELELEKIDDQYYEDPDNLMELVTNYAEAKGLIQPFIK